VHTDILIVRRIRGLSAWALDYRFWVVWLVDYWAELCSTHDLSILHTRQFIRAAHRLDTRFIID
jgi:hypothetical protein